MQRFKNLTKKSGKVASAILSAAMVTSMVLGTNVVEVKAATTDTQDETDVQGVKSVKDLTEAAKTLYAGCVQQAPVNVSQAAIGTAGGTDYWTYLKYLGGVVASVYTGEGYTVTVTPTAIEIKKEPTIADPGVAKLTFEVATKDSAVPANQFGYTDTTAATAEIKLDSYQERINKATEVANKALADFDYNNNTTTKNVADAVNEALSNQIYAGAYALYDDIDVISASALKVNKALPDVDGFAEGSVELKALKANGTAGQYAHGGNVTFKKGIDSNLTRAKKATADLQNYYTSEDLRSTGVQTTSGSVLGATIGGSTTGSALSYLVGLNYTDMNGQPVSKGGVKVTTGSYTLVEKASSDLDGKATIGYQVEVGGTAGEEQKAPAVENLDVTLKSDQTIAEQIVKDIKAIADSDEVRSTVTGTTTAGAFAATLNEEFDATYRKYYQFKSGEIFAPKAFFKATGDTKPTEITNQATPDLQKTLYPDTTPSGEKEFKVTMNFVPKDASADRDGDGKLSISVTVGGEQATDSVAYTKDSNQTEADKAKAAVEEALRNYPVTNATTDEDLKKVVDDAVKDYDVTVKVFTSDRTTATADKEGSIVVKVLITSTKNNELERKAEVNETLTIAKEYKNAFEIKDGKKYYHDENGNLLKNTFLQGTDSPDGYTYYIQNDGSVMQDRLTYHPNGKDVIYFDKDGHEVFDAFVNVKKDVQGNDVDYIGYFGTLGGAYINQTTYGNGVGAYSKDALFYINDYGVLENKGWFQNAAGNIGYAAPNGTLTASQWGIDQFGRKVYFQANGFLAKGLMTDGVKTYQLDETDGHLVGEF